MEQVHILNSVKSLSNSYKPDSGKIDPKWKAILCHSGAECKLKGGKKKNIRNETFISYL